MKKIITLLLAFLYLGISSGIAIEVHYCMGHKAGVDFFGSTDETCSRCGMKEKKGGCCSNEIKFYKLSDSHKNAPAYAAIESPEMLLPPASHLPFFPISDITTLQKGIKYIRPPDNKPSLRILTGVFRL